MRFTIAHIFMRSSTWNAKGLVERDSNVIAILSLIHCAVQHMTALRSSSATQLRSESLFYLSNYFYHNDARCKQQLSSLLLWIESKWAFVTYHELFPNVWRNCLFAALSEENPCNSINKNTAQKRQSWSKEINKGSHLSSLWQEWCYNHVFTA